ncbi:PREDICTED: uncharacterized protein LOC109593473, partial [Amphimedon queenslandica]|uniref:Uncharacterized protein n=2 Tax=Amphimedon queenslandica TaxID=400682 RepID=A0AAN0K4I7_AMPQE
MSSLHTSITSSQSLLYTSSSTSKEYFHTTTNSIEGKTSSSLIPSHSTSPTIQASSPIIQAFSTATTVSSTANAISPTGATISPTALSNGGTSTQFFFILGVSVAALLIIIIVFLLVLIFLFGYKCIKRCRSERLANKTIVDSARNTTGQNPHISTGVNPSYHQHSIITAAGPTCNTGREEGSQMKEGQQNYELVDSNKYDDIHVYF